MSTMDKKRFVSKLKTDKAFLLSLLENPAEALKKYDYKVSDDIIKQLSTIIDRQLKNVDSQLKGKTELKLPEQNNKFVITMLRDAPIALREFKIPADRKAIAVLDKYSNRFLKQIASGIIGGIGPIADNFCEGCNLACSATWGNISPGNISHR